MSGPQMPPGSDLDGRYRLLREIAAGGMGSVWEAEHLALGKRVAVKLLHSTISDVPGVVARFEREARATSELDDPNIVRVIDFGRTPAGQLYLVMDFLNGRTLGTVLESEVPIPPTQAISIVDQMLSGLETAHARGVVHRDLKPDNVMLTASKNGQQVRLLDFGIAAVQELGATTKLTQVGSVMGTPAYMSPEQAMGRALDARTDLYSTGTILYELLCGDPAFTGENTNQVLHKIIVGEAMPLQQRRPGLPTALYQVVERAMARAPADRFATAAAFREALRSVDSSQLVEQPVFRMPAQLAVTDLGSGTTAPIETARPPWEERREARAPSSVVNAIVDDGAPALELEARLPPPVVSDTASSRPLPLGWIAAIVAAALIAVGGYYAYRRSSATTAKANAIIDLVHVPKGARMSLDGESIVGTRLVLAVSDEVHTVRLERPKQAPRVFRFSAQRDQILDVGGTSKP